jgi:hypothetical protein
MITAICPGCGKPFQRLEELKAVHSIGLALFGTCPSCGAHVPCEALWKCTSRQTYKAPDKAMSGAGVENLTLRK